MDGRMGGTRSGTSGIEVVPHTNVWMSGWEEQDQGVLPTIIAERVEAVNTNNEMGE